MQVCRRCTAHVAGLASYRHCSGMHHRGPLHSARHRRHHPRECINTNNDNRRMWLEAAHIDKDAQDLSQVIVGARPTRRRGGEGAQRTAIAHSYIQNINEWTRPHPTSRQRAWLRLRLRLYANPLAQRQCIVRYPRCICCLNHSHYLNWMLDRCRNGLVPSMFSL